ncbi:hypothetical protein G3T36_17640 [Diaminobutyricibacter tongyongensis]|uniref:ADP-ribosylglycohydrolase family protein n=1 Tax=Leifsonia tongyongensis TaxID=1268043 RepID=A0A6L9Y1W6_9MICO|nr:hypothetical protein [Diaminobutyricibacter tongyongensis]
MITEDIRQRFVSVVIAARVGDAMGTPTEGLTVEEIDAQYGWVTDFEGDGTDDSLMATILAETLKRTEGRASSDDWAVDILRNRPEIKLKKDKFFVSVIQLVEKLNIGYRPSTVAVGNMASSSSAMCIWPVALANAAQPFEAGKQAYELARLIHVNDVDHCTDAAAVLAASIAAALRPGTSVTEAIEAGLAVIRPQSGSVFKRVLMDAIDLAAAAESFDQFRSEYHARFSRPEMCDSLETVPAALAIAILANGNVQTAVEYGANFGGDTDTIASMVGALCGALDPSIPSAWLETLGPEAVGSAEGVADDLLTTARARVASRFRGLETAKNMLGSL